MTEKALKVKRKEFLEDTVKYYSENIYRRANTIVCGTLLCAYRTPDGRKCAIGRHIPDEKYKKNIEGNSVHSPIVYNLLPKKISNLGINFLAAVQSLHDTDNLWDEKGLTKDGMGKYKYIEEEFIL